MMPGPGFNRSVPPAREKVRGRKIPLSLPRRIMTDLLAFARAVPTVPVQRQVNVARLMQARERLSQSSTGAPGWCAIFTKAFALTACRFPDLRRAFMTFPRPYLYEHPFSIANIAFEREYNEEPTVFWGHLRRPEDQPLPVLHAELRRFKTEPLQSFGLLRRMFLIGRFPTPVRRLLWWIGLNVSGRKRASYMGTFGVSVYSSLGAESLHPISPLTSVLNYGPIARDGSVMVRIIYDHRVLDGATVARALACLEGILNHEILAELQQQVHDQAA